MPPLQPWKQIRLLTTEQVVMIRRGLPLAKADGWTRNEWAADVAALCGVKVATVKGILSGRRWA